MGGPYAPGEVLWLLQMDRQQAIGVDAYPRDSLMDLSADPNGGGSANADRELFTIARWWDVQRARDVVLKGQRAQHMQIVYERLIGLTEEEVADRHEVNQSTVNRRFRATLRELLAALGGESDDAPMFMAWSEVSACLICGERPRCRIKPIPKRKGVEDTRATRDKEERLAATCPECLAPELHGRMVGRA